MTEFFQDILRIFGILSRKVPEKLAKSKGVVILLLFEDVLNHK
jgi:hypothetical protein